MKLHRLEITAFGPFADPVEVDFDHLSGAGLFLLTGATGAGKTSVLDAVCFALYGDVPGDRNAAKRLRSDHAAPGVAPRVELEATLSGRRFRIVRSPAWERPKKRGLGTTSQQASVTISERVDGTWQTLSSRLDETGHLVTGLVGMNVTQFTQVAMLPQGRFQAFLRARSEERHRLLQQLFRTGRFEEVERWLRERRLALRRDSESARQRVAALVSRISEATDAPLPAAWDADDPDETADPEVLPWAHRLLELAVGARRVAEHAAITAASDERESRTGLEVARSAAERRRRVREALAEQQRLVAEEEAREGDRLALDAARRAASVAPLHRMAAATEAARDRLSATAEQAGARAATELGLLLVDDESLTEALQQATDEAAQVRAAQPRARRLGGLSEEIHRAHQRLTVLTERRQDLEASRAQLPHRLRDLRTARSAAGIAASDALRLESGLVALEARLDGHVQAGLLTGELEVARAELATASQRVTACREQWLDLREARLDGMAAEIAGALAVGACCPVCGSAEHPQKASAAADAPDARAERSALKRLDDAKATEHLHDERVRDLSTRLAVAHDKAGDRPVAEVRDEVSRQREALRALRADADRAPSLDREMSQVERDIERLADELGAAAQELAALEATVAERTAEHRALQDEIGALLGGAGDLDSRLEAHLQRATTGRAALQALRELATAEQSLRDAESALAEAVSEAGFLSAAEAQAALLPEAAVAAGQARLDDHQRRVAAVQAVLDAPDAAALAAGDDPDLTALADSHRAALAALGEAGSQVTLWQSREQRLAELTGELERALETWAPLRQSLALVAGLASFVDGRAPDNRLQMRLSAYVLAYRLSQVVAAANERLARMSDQRYSLEHTGRRGAGETRGGLSLLVRDDWSGETRDPATLSGGETFVVSLALALGLADVITQEAGGADLDTLFVDEGFGSLDADTLDDVMDTLDSLRDGGRVVGVVSHVAEMRDRIPTQLQVTKSRRGSTLSVTR